MTPTPSSFTILASAGQVPAKVVTNDDLAARMDTSDEWIRQRTGIHTRHIAGDDESTSTLCTTVAQQLLHQAGIGADQLSYIVVATMSPDYATPATAAQVQGAIGAANAVAFDISAACSGFVYGLHLMQRLLAGPDVHYGLVLGGETLSRLVDWTDRSTAVLFGDGAGGVLLSNQGSGQYLGRDLRTLGDQGAYLTARALHGQAPSDAFLHMNGRKIYTFAVRAVPRSLQAAVDQAGLSLDQVDHFLLHQANARIITQVAKELDQPLDKFPMNIAAVGNTAAASEPLLLAETISGGQIQRGEVLALCGFGGGLTVGTVVLRY
ncbi:beta-ketoacyl-ACP synthase III [Schleiferilactobacillus harbinensis]|uniref:Beta-ketoacyl-[acyl-carrier-protein] synthase III n=1 Tax=Schleiferilactobacillus harbinensis DSM 16991 TaxID=1122147 RepID=A0A0R1XI25_9LACO|nr:beta-ketoacyl-ACP synthase III [Schleiferilactobacillus harbinensis]KRM29714.1 3-oxoacyl-(acyl carrier protein) synthase III [Schleiferilactobacillus harbinensis DSM 16991]QFR63227.1 beta-ketoacyl-ACP synthase III [Schleiferilactobacillus harbinensis]